MENIADDQRLEDVELEMSAHASNTDSGVVADDLGTNHGHGLTLGRVDLTGHD